MFNGINTYKKAIVALFLMAIPSVYICMILCDLDIYSLKRVCYTSVCKSSEEADIDHHHDSKSPEHHHNPLSSHEQEGEDHHQTHSEQKSSKPEDCCDDMTSSVLGSLFSNNVQLPTLEAKLFFIFEINIPEIKVSGLNILSDLYTIYSDSSPPSDVCDLFIFVQSFRL